MLQALKLDATSAAPPRKREPETETSGLEAGFAALLAQAAWLTPAPPPTAQAPQEPAKSTEFEPREPRPAADRSGSQTQGPAPRPPEAREPRAPSPEHPEGSPAEARAADPGKAETPAAAESSAGESPDPETQKVPIPLATTRTEEGADVTSTGLTGQAPIQAVPGDGRKATAHASLAEGGRISGANPSLPAPHPPETQELRLRVEPEVARTWSATGTALRPLQEFLAQPRPPLETPAPLRETPPAPAPPATAQAGPATAAPAQTEAGRPQPEGFQPGTAVHQSAVAAARTPGTSREVLPRQGQVATPVAGLMGARAASAPETTPAATLPRAAAPALQVEGSIRWMLQNRHRGAELHLHPESLGRVTIRLTVEGTEVHARVWASEASTLPLLQEHRAHLEQSLRDQGLSLGSFDLNQGSRGDASQEPNKPQSGRATSTLREPAAPQQDLPTPGPALPGGARLLEVFA